MPSRDVWKHGSGKSLRDLLSSALVTLLLPVPDTGTVYFASPWMSDFDLFDNTAREVVALFPDRADQDRIRFVQYLGALSSRADVRIIISRNHTADAFVEQLRAHARAIGGWPLHVRLAPQATHEKGILAPGFYIDGSMNLTHMGVHVNGEKIAYHPATDRPGAARVAAAYLEFDRRWNLLASDEVE